jgi:Domain of unknown function (DUF6429)
LGCAEPALRQGHDWRPGEQVNKAKSVVFTEEGLKRAEELFQAMFTKPD